VEPVAWGDLEQRRFLCAPATATAAAAAAATAIAIAVAIAVATSTIAPVGKLVLLSRDQQTEAAAVGRRRVVVVVLLLLLLLLPPPPPLLLLRVQLRVKVAHECAARQHFRVRVLDNGTGAGVAAANTTTTTNSNSLGVVATTRVHATAAAAVVSAFVVVAAAAAAAAVVVPARLRGDDGGVHEARSGAERHQAQLPRRVLLHERGNHRPSPAAPRHATVPGRAPPHEPFDRQPRHGVRRR
jgi:hypothetical protein